MKRVLIVDGDKECRMYLQRELEKRYEEIGRAHV